MLEILILAAALLNFIPYVVHYYTWFFVFFSLTPLLYGVVLYPASFRAGFLWGFCVAWLHCGVLLSSALYSFFNVGIVTCMALLCWIAVYAGLHAGFLFFCADYVQRVLPLNNLHLTYQRTIRCILFCGALTLFSLWFSDYCCVFFGHSQGLIFAHALMLFGKHIQWIQQLVAWVNLQGTVMLLILLQGALVVAYSERTRTAYMLLLLALIPWLCGYHYRNNDYFLPAWHTRVAYVPHVPLSKKKIENMVKPRDIVFMPEAALCTCVTELPYMLMVFPHNLHVILGVCCADSIGKVNSLLYLHNNVIEFRYDKQFLALFTECMPTSWENIFAASEQQEKYVRGTKARTPFVIDGTIQLVPYICSELFYNHQPDDTYDDIPIAALCGNAWAKASYIQELFLLGIAVRALQWQRDVIYISSSHGAFISKWGNIREIEPCRL